MRDPPWNEAVALALTMTVLLGSSCAARHPHADASGPVATFGVYRAWLSGEAGSRHRFRLLLYAALPDRLHAEVLPPMGGPSLLLDGGSGRLAVTLVRERVAYVGEASPEILRRVVGVELSLEELVRAVLTGEVNPGPWRVRREGSIGAGLPERFELVAKQQTLRIELARRRALKGRRADLGTGTPPEGVERRPLSEVPIGEAPSLLVKEAGIP